MSAKFLTAEESRLWCTAGRVEFNGFEQPVLHAASDRHVFPNEIGRRVFWCHVLWATVCEPTADEILVWTKDRHVWDDHMPLVDAWMRGLGATTSIDETPGFKCAESNLPDGQSLLLLCSVFGWDCWAINKKTGRAVYVCHDDWCQVGTLGRAADDSWIKELVLP
jgi:hypothetical protein